MSPLGYLNLTQTHETATNSTATGALLDYVDRGALHDCSGELYKT
jgi:hypothetical protein